MRGSGRPAAPTAGDLQSLPCRPKLHEASTIAAGRRLHSPALSTGPEFKRTFDPLVERLWAWRDDQMLATVAAVFKERGVPWASVVNALLPENGAAIRAALRQPAWARLPAFAVA